ncbi:MAG TPA: DNA mismatch repair protein MutS [Dictyoglomaceae bacterium]|nr:DNA mismatch repair protein MutS [Dictyoglomaceae bacterium]HOL38742.1 DNA mismatch repair protein MutS [Dictyoglomaceae bacterium]HOP94554.1 DNA mismatch repair protein MutS [Dictyoglomaceae bacterium]HPP15509.1 DNA mismatch repair protein MutS [Dictyoglomaceae bacterium]HPU43082.1 DNA mismatch repair protein MutS [Dictyoglomaceae bacterium]
MENMTPLYKQYKSIKDKFSDTILLFRLGDFYEAFEEDAKIISQELDIVLTSKEVGKGKRIPMAGVPYHALDSYLSKLVQKNYKVAICEQMEDPALAKGLVKREVVRVITPGTLLEDTLLEDKNNNFLTSLFALNRESIGMSAIDVSTGEFLATEWSGSDAKEIIYSELIRIKPKEIILSISFRDYFGNILSDLKRELDPKVTFVSEDYFNTVDYSLEFAEDKDRYSLGLKAAYGILNYIKEVMFTIPTHIKKLEFYKPQQFLILDSTAIKHLELFETVREGQRRGSLIWVLDKTLTSMGTRLLKKSLLQPLLNVNYIRKRQEAVKEFLEKEAFRKEMEETLKEIPDLERINSRINYNIATPKELIYLRQALYFLPTIKKILENVESEKLTELKNNLPDLEPLYERLNKALVESPPAHLKEGGFIKDGYNQDLDDLRGMLRDSRKWLADLENRERERTGIKSLKIGYNQVFGYYIEVTKANLNLVPSEYIRKQTLVNAERFITPELKEWENKILHAEENIKNLEERLFQELREDVVKNSREISSFAQIIAEIDMYISLAKTAREYNYICPQVTNDYDVIIREGRHPVIERMLPPGAFVPNDVYLNKEKFIDLITGPNMAGKSTYIRQTALIIILAQMGSFIPAKEAKIGVVDRIFTRIGAWDDISSGESTFLVEMKEVGNILSHATDRSLIILDEVGRGTSTYDGISIAWAIVEYIHNKIKAKTLFATHYHELTELEKELRHLKNLSVAVQEKGKDIIFLHKIVEKPADKSYGIYVAQLADLPNEIIEKAEKILFDLEKGREIQKREVKQLPLFTEINDSKLEKLRNEILSLNTNELTPIQALLKIHEWKELIK